ncbi:MAG: type II toxin-antitoxin system RelE/ParE family toxin [Nitrospinae bacterium]|nr:type II toxin-antitoxin system RelE/ParE family toxin [Nitrospinota bacterium]
MEVYFRKGKLRKICESEPLADRKFGKVRANKLRQRLTELQAAETLEMMMRLPAARCHALKGDRKGWFAVDLDHPYRLIFEPTRDPPPRRSDGGLDLSRITEITILEITAYHEN